MRLSRDSYVSCSYLIELMLLMYRFIPPLVVLVPHDSNVAVYTQVCFVLSVTYAIVRLNSRNFASLLHSELFHIREILNKTTLQNLSKY